MPPIVNTHGTPSEPHKSWKKINEERKALKKQRKQEKQIKLLEKHEEQEQEQLEESAKISQNVKVKRENPSTLSIAVPGSILENAQSAELRTYVAGQIARAACIFRVNEVIVFDDIGWATAKQTKRIESDEGEDEDETLTGASKTVRASSLQLARILQYLECPQYLRKFFFPLHKDLKYSGLLNPLDTPHHLRQQNSFTYREGIISDKKAKEGFSYVNVGLLNDVLVNKAIEPGVRVTVKLHHVTDTSKKLRGTIVSPDEPRRDTGVYWGYQVRIAHTISEIFTKSPYEDGYDITIGTSDRGANVHNVEQKSLNYKHILIVFGGLKGLEGALANDEQLNIDDPALLFDHYINVLPRQGSRTIRTEEALLIALSSLQEKLNPENPDIEEDLSQFLPTSEDTGGSLIPNQQFTKKKKKQKPFEETLEGNESFKKLPSIEKDDTHPSKIKKLSSNPFDIKREKAFASPIKNPFNKNKDSISNDDFNSANKHSFDRNSKNCSSPNQKKFNNDNSFKNKTKNPFKPRESEIKSIESTVASNIANNVEDDFEIVPVSIPGKKLTKPLAASDDLSRFD